MESNALAIVAPQHIQPAAFFTPDQEQMILRDFLGGASKDEANVLLEIVKRRRLDPFSRQVYFVKRWDAAKRSEVWAIQTSIDGLRSIAERTGKYDGQDEPVYGEDEAGKFCKVKVYRKDWSPSRGAVGVAYLSEFIQKKKDGTVTQFWQRMPRLMLAKCAEALAIRKAFPEDTGGLYISEEMGEDKDERLPAKRAETVQAAPAIPANVAAAAQVLEATIEPESAIDAEVQRSDAVSVLASGSEAEPERLADPSEVQALWDRLVTVHGGNKSEAAMAWKDAAVPVFGEKVPKTAQWKGWQFRAVERNLSKPSTDDIPF